jgi:hypothetical protein
VAKALQVSLVDLVAIGESPRDELVDATRELSEAQLKEVLRAVQRAVQKIHPSAGAEE